MLAFCRGRKRANVSLSFCCARMSIFSFLGVLSSSRQSCFWSAGFLSGEEVHKCIFQFFAVLACLFSLFWKFYQARGRAASGVLAFCRARKRANVFFNFLLCQHVYFLFFWSSIKLEVELLLECWLFIERRSGGVLAFLVFLEPIWQVVIWFIVDFRPNCALTHDLMRFSLIFCFLLFRAFFSDGCFSCLSNSGFSCPRDIFCTFPLPVGVFRLGKKIKLQLYI